MDRHGNRKLICAFLLALMICTFIPQTTAYSMDIDSEEDNFAREPPLSQDPSPSLQSLLQLLQNGEDDREMLYGRLPIQDQEHHIHLKATTFDPIKESPRVPKDLLYDSPTGYYLVQCEGPVQPDWIETLKISGAAILGYMPDYTYLVHMDEDAGTRVEDLTFVRWKGYYHPAYKIQPGLTEKTGEIELNVIVFINDVQNIKKVKENLIDLGGLITQEEDNNNVIRVRIQAARIRDIAFIPEVEWMDLYSPPISFMNHVQDFTGAEYLHNIVFDGTGIVGEVKDNGCDLDHPDFEGQLIGTDGNPGDGAHGTCTFGIVFSSGANDADAEGMMPGGAGVFSDWDVGRNTSITNLINNWGGLFQSNSWSQGSLDSTYTSISQENDEAIFYHDISMLYAAGNSNSGVGSETLTRDSVAKNVICVGAVYHYDDADTSNDDWHSEGSGATPSQGPASDGRIKPDLAGVFDWIYTTDSVDGDGNDGYASGNYYNNMGGTSGATPIAAGAAGLVYQMYIEDHFGNNPSGNIPHAATLKAILIADAFQYEFSQADRYQQGWGLVDVQNVYDIAKNHFIVDQDVSLQTGESTSFMVGPTGSTPMKISLVWTDVPGTTSSSQHLINDLDLKVTAPGGEIYYGNVGLEGSKWSSQGGTADTLNNVENVFIENPQPGEWSIEVIAQNIAMDGDPQTPAVDQHFALVASGVLQAQHDVGVADLLVPNYLAPNEVTIVEATVYNNGITEESGLQVNFTVDGIIQDTTSIANLDSGAQTQVQFDWVPPTGIYMVGIEVARVPDENYTQNNLQEKEVIVEPDVAISNILSDNYLKVKENSQFDATVENLGKVDLSGVMIQLLVNGSLKDNFIISSLPGESSQVVTLEWTPDEDGWFEIEVYAVPVADEELVSNNRLDKSLYATSMQPVYVAVLDSWGNDFPEHAPWDYLNDNWMHFGPQPVVIDYTDLHKDDITYDDLVQEDADVLFISSAFAWAFSDDEVDAIERYVQEGRGMIATAATFYYEVPNNNKLAPMFGMRDDISYDAWQTSTLNIMQPAHPLFRNMPNPYSPNNAITGLPADYSWDVEDLTEGTYVAKSPDNMGSIVVNRGIVYISHWIEYESSWDDVQLLYNAMVWSIFERGLRDVAVVDMDVKPYLGLGETTFLNATIANIGLADISDITIEFTVDGNLESTTAILDMDSGEMEEVTFQWTAPALEGSHILEIRCVPVADENITTNNHMNTTVLVTSGPRPGRIGLISDANQLQAVTSILDEMGKHYDILNSNTANQYTQNISRLLLYQMVFFYNDDRAISEEEQTALEDYIALGGVLIVTGFDSMGSPDDPLLAELVRSTVYGDDMGINSFEVINGAHPITYGLFGQFPAGSQYNVGQSDHDNAEADIQRGARTIAELSDGQDKIIATELASGGIVVFWNGNRDCDDWTQPNIEGMFRNMVTWILPIYNDVGILSFDNPSLSYVGDSVNIGATIENSGVNDQNDVKVLLEVQNSQGYIIHTDTKTGLALETQQSTLLTWQWVPTFTGDFTLEVTNLLANDEIPSNDIATNQITIFTRFFEDDMESGVGQWEATDTSPARDELWHLTTGDSHTPATSWWCGDESTNQYTVWANQYLTTPVIDLNNATYAVLKFWHKYGIDDFPVMSDWGYVQIQTESVDWTDLDSYSGTSMAWTEVVFDISPYVGSDAQIRFFLSSGVVLTDNGWWVDDIELYGMEDHFELDVNAQPDTDEVGKDESAVYDVHISNTGNALGTVELVLLGQDIEDWTVAFSDNDFDLEPGESRTITLTVTPQNAFQGDYELSVSGALRSAGILRASDTYDISLTVEQWFGVSLELENAQLDFIPSEIGYYNITVTNVGNGPDSVILSTDHAVTGTSSWDYELSRTSISLEAFETGNLTLEVTSPSNGLVGDGIQIDVTGRSQRDSSETETVSTTSQVVEYYEIRVSSEDPQKETDAGSPVDFTLYVDNLGNSQVTINLNVAPQDGNWNGWSAFLGTKTMVVGAYSSQSVSLTVTPPSDAIAFDYNEFEITATSTGSSSNTVVRAEIALTGDLDVSVSDSSKSAKNGEMALYPIDIANMQNHDDTVDVSASSENGWQVHFFTSDGIVPLGDTDSDGRLDTGLLDAWYGEIRVVVGVEIPSNAEAFTQDTVTITFSSSLTNGSVKSILLTTESEISGDIQLSPESDSASELPEREILYLVTVKNNINYQARIDIEVTSENQWEVGVFTGDSFTPLGDTNGNGDPDTGLLNALGGTRDVLVVLMVPDDAVAHTTDIITVMASTQALDSAVHSVQLTAVVERVYDVEMIFQDGDLSVTRGEELLYMIKLENNGNYQEELDLRFEELPNGWRGGLSNSEPLIPVGESKVIAVSVRIPKDADYGDHLVKVVATSSDGTEAGELEVTVNVQKEDEGFDIPLLWVIVLVFVVLVFVIIFAVAGRRSTQEVAYPLHQSAGKTQPVGYGEFFPEIENISCPNCREAFEVEVIQRPFNVTCPSCGARGIMR